MAKNLEMGKIEEAQEEFEAFKRDKKMDKLRSIVLATGTVVATVSVAIATHKACPELVKSVGNILSSAGAKFARNHQKIYNAIAKKFPELVGNVGEDFATRVLDSTNVIPRIINKFISNKAETGKIVEKLAGKGIKNLGDIVGIGIALVGSLFAGAGTSKIGNMLDDYGDSEKPVKPKNRITREEIAEMKKLYEQATTV